LTHHWDDRYLDHVHTSRLVAAVHHPGWPRSKRGKTLSFQTIIISKFTHIMPSFVVDISDYIEQRSAAISAYRSQLDPSSSEPSTTLSQPEFLTHVETIHSFYGTLIGKKKGEAFHIKGVLEIKDPVQHFK
jgi:LmbE family N-acetylglucosaminyl deacetylase